MGVMYLLMMLQPNPFVKDSTEGVFQKILRLSCFEIKMDIFPAPLIQLKK